MLRLRYLRPLAVAALVAVSSLGVHAGDAFAQSWPTQPVTLFDGRLLVAGDASVTYGSADPGWFTYADYETDTLRRMHAGLTVEARVSRRLILLAELRAETGLGIRPYAWYVRLNPLDSGAVTIQAGRIPPVFGAYGRRNYPQDNPLIGVPLVYQYLTTMRADAVPASADDLARMRGRGWAVHYPVGNAYADSGLPIVSASRWDTGIQARFGTQTLEGAVAVTAGTLSNPVVRDDNAGRQLAGRLAWRPLPALSVGLSAARGALLGRDVLATRSDIRDTSSRQQAVGVDVETSWDRWLVRGEFVVNQWSVPAIDSPAITKPLAAHGGYVEGRVRVRPGLFVAARADRIWFSSIRTSTGDMTWDADVSRVELGLGYTIRRGLLLKSSVLSHWRDGGQIRRDTLVGVQLSFWL
ncbi:MAG: hypothetical protein NTV05_17370 [Acidobacteria bacterium]|nr:hypothetical protein [Acidobacteriota bacterium]